MNNVGLAFYTLSLCFLFASATLFLIDLTASEKSLFGTARTLLMAAFACLTILIVGRGVVYRYMPLYTFHETLLFLVWTAAFVLLVLDRAYHTRTIYHFTVPFLFALLFFAFFFPADRADLVLYPELKSVWLISHIISVIVAYGTFAVAFIISLMYLLVDHYLKRKKLSSVVVKLPSLDTLDLYNHKLVTVGFFLLTVSIFLGAMEAQNVWGAFWRWEPKEIWSVVTWIIYAIYLHTRLMSGWQGRKVAMFNTIGFATVLFNYVIVRFFFATGLHQFY